MSFNFGEMLSNYRLEWFNTTICIAQKDNVLQVINIFLISYQLDQSIFLFTCFNLRKSISKWQNKKCNLTAYRLSAIIM